MQTIHCVVLLITAGRKDLLRAFSQNTMENYSFLSPAQRLRICIPPDGGEVLGIILIGFGFGIENRDRNQNRIRIWTYGRQWTRTYSSFLQLPSFLPARPSRLKGRSRNRNPSTVTASVKWVITPRMRARARTRTWTRLVAQSRTPKPSERTPKREN